MADPTLNVGTDSRKPLTFERLRELIHYNPDTGVFTWRQSRGANRCQGKETCKSTRGKRRNQYRRIKIDYVTYTAHHLAWLYMTGQWPSLKIDHRNGLGDDNRWENLREATSAQNAWNTERRVKNRFGLKGVVRVSESKRFRATIYVNRKMILLGNFDTPEEAHEAYKAAVLKYHGEFALPTYERPPNGTL